MRLVTILVALIAGLSGCSTAGPFVTHLASDGVNGLAIEKCKVHFNALLGYINTGDCTTSHITLK
jgi:type IV secretion system protein VirB7